MIRESLDKGILPETLRHSIISLIYKSGEKTRLTNYRPISLTNMDFRILTQVLAKRLQPIMKHIISDEQTAYVKGRFISNNIRLLDDVYNFCEILNQEGVLISLDFKKAFDSLEWRFIEKCLEMLNFGPKFIDIFRLIYNKPTFSIKNNNWITKPQTMSRGIRQGCSVSALIFILSTEIMTQKIKNNPNITGLEINGKKSVISQYADDST